MGWSQRCFRMLVLAELSIASASASAQPASPAPAISTPAPAPRVDAATSADWVFAFKLNVATFPTTGSVGECRFGGKPKSYRSSQHYVVASSLHPQLHDGPGLLGTGSNDPVGATFELIYRSDLNFVVWNDQFYRHPNIAGCSENCGGLQSSDAKLGRPRRFGVLMAISNDRFDMALDKSRAAAVRITPTCKLSFSQCSCLGYKNMPVTRILSDALHESLDCFTPTLETLRKVPLRIDQRAGYLGAGLASWERKTNASVSRAACSNAKQLSLT